MFVIRKCLAYNKTRRPDLKNVLFFCNHVSDENCNIIRSSIPEINIPELSLPDFIFTETRKWPNKIALECGETGRCYTYEELRTKSENLSKALRKILKLEKGNVVAIMLPNIPEFAIAFLGAAQAGLVVTTVNTNYTPEELFRQISDSNSKTIISMREYLPTVENTLQKLKKSIPVLLVKKEVSEFLPHGTIDFKQMIDTKHEIASIYLDNQHDDVALPYSSGTTGTSKGVQLSHYNIVANICQANAPEIRIGNETTENSQDAIPVLLPMFHIYGLTGNLLTKLHLGIKIVTVPKFTPELYVSVLKKHRPNHLYLVPPMVLFFTNHLSVKPEHLQSLETVTSGGAALGILDEEKFIQKANKSINIFQAYGLTETSPLISQNFSRLRQQRVCPGSIGQVIPSTTLKVIAPDDPTGRPLGPNETGELLVKGPQVMKGYYNKPKETEETFLNGWLRTGDIVHYDENKYFYVTDRLKELIKVRGFQVAPAELEEVIRDFSGVDETAVVGVNHKLYGEVPRAYVVQKRDANVNIDKLKEFVASKLAHYKKLSGGVVLVDSIPKTASGKILRRVLKTQYNEGM